MEKGHYGHYSGNARHSRVTSHNMAATKRDDEAHMQYLKEDVKYDNKHGHSDIDMTADEKHISKLAGDLKYDEKHHGSARHDGTDNNHNGDITESPSKFTQVVRRFKNDQTGPFSFARNLATTALAIAPIPSIGKLNVVKNVGKAVSSKVKEVKMFGPRLAFQSLEKTAKDLAKPISPSMQKALNANMPKSTSQNLQEAFSYPREVLKHKFPTSKPVNFKGPNPANKIGAGGNSYPR